MERIKEIYMPAQDSAFALLPCPFCGENSIRYEQYETATGDRWRVCCYACSATLDPGYAQEKIDVAVLWNRRTERSEK